MDMISMNYRTITVTTDAMAVVECKTLKGKFRSLIFSSALLLVCLFAGVTPAVAQDFDHSHAVYDGILKQFVQKGRVDYVGIKANLTPLNLYLAQLGRVVEKDFNRWSETQKIAYLSNLYNASTLKLIEDHYPVKSIKDIGSFFKGPWDQPAVRLSFCSQYLSEADQTYLKAGGYSVKYLSYDWALNERKVRP
jgi:hypothetical protein